MFTYDPAKELTMDIRITLKDKKMRDLFVNGLREAGYTTGVSAGGNTVTFTFANPKTKQPISPEDDKYKKVQAFNESLVNDYLLVKKYLGVNSNDPNLINEKAINKGTVEVKNAYERLAKYLKSIANPLKI